MTTTRNLRDLAANLRHIANLLESAEVGELASPVTVRVAVHPGLGDDVARMEAVDQLATITGQPADWRGEDAYAPYQTELSQDGWTLASYAYMRRPDPAVALKAENEKLRTALRKIKKIAGKHTEVDGCACEDCRDLAGSDG